MSSTCIWCGRTYDVAGSEIIGGFCGRKCAQEYENERTRGDREAEERRHQAAERRKLDEIKALEQERLAIERRREKMELERIRKADPKQWYGSEWVEHLLVHPEDADKCQWKKLESADIRILLETHPQFVNRVDLEVLSAGSWSRLLMKRPEFGEKCTKWSKIDAEHWIMLLKERKEFASKCSFSRWVEILSCDISFRKYCDFSLFNSKQATILLTQLPQLATEFDKSVLANIDLKSRAEVLCKYPKLEGEIKGWNDFSGYSEELIVKILSKVPSFLGRFQADTMDLITAKDRFALLLKHPDFIKGKWFSDWFIFSPRQQFELLYAHKEFSKYCFWESFDKAMWEKLLEKYPDFKEQRDKVIEFLRTWTDAKKGIKITAKDFWEGDLWAGRTIRVDWKQVAKEKPEIASVCFFRNTCIDNDKYEVTINTLDYWIYEFPEVIRCVDWTNRRWASSGDISRYVASIIRRCLHSRMAEKTEETQEGVKEFLKALSKVHRSFFEHIDEDGWRLLIKGDPYFAQFCQGVANLDFSRWDIAENPSLLSCCNLSKLNEKDWEVILDAHPELLARCGIVDKLKESSVWSYRVALDENLLSNVPEKIDLDWEVILSYNPKMAAKCNKDMLYRRIARWSRILCKHPQLFPIAKSCGAIRHRFDKNDWNHLIEEQPQFKNEYWKWRIARFFGSFFRKLFYTTLILAALGGVGYCVLNYASESTLAMIRGVWEKAITVWTDISAKVVSIDYQSVVEPLAIIVGLITVIILFVWWWIRRAVKTFSKKRWKFLFIGLFLGFLGLHLAYAKRWKLFGLSCVIALMAYQASNYGLLFVFWGLTTFFIKKDGNGNRM